ncbi:APC family permease [Phycicoccus sp. Soil803]|uniref:APC family permease n=1 Tax=Phycicoccus sp. Soil803 TaxID=1736415 RepID=UPI0009EA5492|nr:APC family permease [Phycicoccus sp. Soil803]
MSNQEPRRLNAAHLLFFVIAAAAPLGFSVGTIPLALGRGSTGYALAVVVTAVVLGIFAVGYVAMSRHISRRGGLYEFVTAGLGRSMGTGAAFMAAVTYACAATGAVGVLAVLAGNFALDTFGLDAPWWVWALLGAVVMGILGVLNVELNARLLGVVITIEVAILLIVCTSVLVQGGAGGLTLDPFKPAVLFDGSVGTTFALAIVAFAGFEATVIYSSETRDRARTIRRAAIGALVLMSVLYAYVSWAIVVALGSSATVEMANANPVGVFFAVTDRYVGSGMRHFVELMVVFSWFASVLAFHNATARYLAAMGNDGLIPRWFAVLSTRTRAPWRSSVAHTALTIGAVLVTIALGADPFLDLFVLGSSPALIGIPALEIAASVAIVVFFAKDRRGHGVWEVLVAPTVAATLLAVFLWQIVDQLDLFTGRGGRVNAIIIGSVAGAFVLGLIRGAYLDRRAPRDLATVVTPVDDLV